MKKIFVLYILFLLACIKIFTMELATESTIVTFSSELDSHQKKLDWINEKDQKLIITALLGLQQSKLLNDDLCKTIAHKLFVLYTEKEYKNLEKICPLKLGNQEYKIEQMALMSYSHRKRLINMAHPNLLRKLNGYNNQMILESDYKELLEILPDNTKKDLEIDIIPNSFFCMHLPKIIGILLSSVGIGLGIAGIITSNITFLPGTIFSIALGPTVGICLQESLNECRASNSQEYKIAYLN